MKKLLSALALFSSAAYAGTATGTVVHILVMQDGALIVELSTTITGRPACAVQPSRFAVEATSTAGKVQAAAVLSAFALQKTIGFVGSNACATWSGGSETVNYFSVSN